MLQASRSHRLAGLAIRARVATLPANVTWGHFAAAGMPAGIGSRSSLVIAGLAFAEQAPAEPAKVGILLASVDAATTGSAMVVALARAAR
jgi:NhaA family Na+:H+ antiporter